jgi:outer membrane protein assembly factor BamB
MKHNSIRPIRVIIISFLLVFGICTTYVTADDFDWPRWRGPNGNGTSLETDWDPKALAGGPKILWKMDVGAGYSNVVIKDNRLYTIGIAENRKENVVSCLNADNGELIWQYTFETSQSLQFPHSTPTIDGKYVYALTVEGLLFCIKAKNGKVLWEKNLVMDYNTEEIPYGYSGSPVIEGDLIILNVNTAGIALNKKTGDLIWASPVHTDKRNPYGYHATPVLYDYKGKRYALLFSGTGLYSVEVETGKQLWYFEFITFGEQAADPVFFKQKVFISTGYTLARCALLEITGNEPQVMWENENLRNKFSSSIYIDGYLYGSDGDEGKVAPIRCIDVKTGDVMWEKKMKMASLIAANGKLIILDEEGNLHIAEATPSSYKEISSGDILGGERKPRMFYTPPVLYKGNIYCKNFRGYLVCIDVSK